MKLQIVSLWIVALQLSTVASANPGFLTADDRSLPVAVKEACRSVFKLYSQGGRFDKTIDMTDALAISEEKEKLKSDDNWWESSQLHFCEQMKIQSCPLFAQMGEGSAFLAGDQNTIYTDLHNFYEVLSAKVKMANASSRSEILKTLNQTPLLMAAGSADQKPDFDPTTNTARLNFFNPDPALFDGTMSAMLNPLGRLSDIVELKAASAINTLPLKTAPQKPKAGEVLYLIGYPAETNDRQPTGGHDSDGQSILVTVGKVMSTQTWMQKTQNNIDPIVEILFDQYMIFADFDCEHGNSGGPIVNGSGEVVGIMMGMWKDLTNASSTRICGGLNTLNQNELKQLWQGLAN